MVNNFQHGHSDVRNKEYHEVESYIIAGDIVDTIVRIMNKAVSIEKDPIDIGHGTLLYPSEVHLIDMAGRFPDENVSQIASRLGITKGAVSQTAKKLEEKGYLEKVKRENDKKTIVLRLTEYGKDAFRWHRAYHETMNRKMAAEVSGMGERDIANLKIVLVQIEEMLENCPEVRKRLHGSFRERYYGIRDIQSSQN